MEAVADTNPTTSGWRRISIRAVGYWLLTGMVALEMVAGSMWDLLRIEFVRGVFDQLGYPHYLLLIIGAWKLPCAVTLLVPGFPRLKEWAYAGAVFNFTGAAASHLLAGHGPAKWIGPLLFAGIVMGSWALRPPARRLADPPPRPRELPAAWLVPLGVFAAFLIFSLLTLPQGPPPP